MGMTGAFASCCGVNLALAAFGVASAFAFRPAWLASGSLGSGGCGVNLAVEAFGVASAFAFGLAHFRESSA